MMDIVERLNWLCTDWDKSQMVDGEPPLDAVRVGDLRKAAAEITRLRARLEEAEAAKADAWDEGYNSGRLDEMADKQMRSNPYRIK